MTNIEKYEQIFLDCFSVDKGRLDDKFVYQCVAEWDSVGHMGMIAAIEDTFNIMMETDDIINFGSYTVGKDILSKYDIEF
jgi:acyl carrier protein